MIDYSQTLMAPAEMMSFVQIHAAKAGNYDPSERQHLRVIPALAQPVDDRFDPTAAPRAVVTRDISPKCIGLVHSARFRDSLIALQMSLADELVILVVELQWCMKLGPYFYSGGHFVSRLNSFPKYSPTALHLGTDTAPRRHILVVDDSCISAQLVQYNLEQSGFETSTASDGREAWMKAQEQQFDLILTDEHMPSMNGTELCQLLRSHDLYRETPIVLFTTTGKLANISELREELNIAATVYKSFKPADLLRAIEFAFRVPVALPT